MKRFELYLQRHIELDGDIHSHLAKKLVAQICRSEKEWDLAENSALTAIKSRFVNVNQLLDNKSIFQTHILGQRIFCYSSKKTKRFFHQLWHCQMRCWYWKSGRWCDNKMRSKSRCLKWAIPETLNQTFIFTGIITFLLIILLNILKINYSICLL